MPKFPDARVAMYRRDHPDMNAFAILGRCHSALRESDLDDLWEEFHAEATAGDYEHLLSTVRRWFSTYSDGTEWLNNRSRIHDAEAWVAKPCHQLRWCPYGQLVEAFPVHPEAAALAEERGWFVRMESTHGATIYPIRWVPATADEDGAMPDLNRLRAEGLLDDTYSCSVFGHSCPAFYLAEAVSEDSEG